MINLKRYSKPDLHSPEIKGKFVVSLVGGKEDAIKRHCGLPLLKCYLLVMVTGITFPSQAIKNNAGFRVWILFFLVMCSFSLLFLDWYDN